MRGRVFFGVSFLILISFFLTSWSFYKQFDFVTTIERNTQIIDIYPQRPYDNFYFSNGKFVTPEMFGAMGDGIHDDTDAMEKAITSGKDIRLVNKYLVSRTLYPIRSIYGESGSEIIMNSQCDIKLFKLMYPQVVLSDFKISGNANSVKKNLSGYAHGVDIEASNIKITHLRVENCGGDGIYIGGDNDVKNIIIENCNINRCNRNGISVISARDFLITSCTIRNIYGVEPQSGIDIEPNHSRQSISGIIEKTKTENCKGRGISVVMEHVDSNTCFNLFLDSLQSNNDGSITGSQYSSSFYITEYSDCSKCMIEVKNALVLNSKNSALKVRSLSTSPCVLKVNMSVGETDVIPAVFMINNASSEDIESYDITMNCLPSCTNYYSANFQRLSLDLQRTYHIRFVSNKPYAKSLNKLPIIISK